MKKFISAIHNITYFLSWIATGALSFMVVITSIDVFARYVFNAPILGSNELVESSMVVFVYGAMAHATVARTHVCANVVDPLLSKRQREILGAFAFTVAGMPGLVNGNGNGLGIGFIRIPTRSSYRVFRDCGRVIDSPQESYVN